MEFKGRIVKLMEPMSGTSSRTGNSWQSREFVFEYFEQQTDRYADRVLLQTFDTTVMEQLKEGDEVICGFGHRTREYNGRFYNELRLYKFQKVNAQQQQPIQNDVFNEQSNSNGEPPF